MKEDTKNRYKSIIFIGSWIATASIGLSLIAFLFAFAIAARGGQLDEFDVALILFVSNLTFLVGWLILLQVGNKSLFARYSRWALLVGVALCSGIAFFGMFVTVSTQSSENAQCSTLDDRLYEAQAATVPIITDKDAAGTAFAIDDRGTLLTAYHVIQDANEVYANYTSGKTSIKVKSTAPDVDLAVLEIDEPTPDYLSLTSNYSLGSELYAYGYPKNSFDAGQASLSTGVLSRVISREDIELNTADKVPDGLELVQTDAAMNPGNSGGPVVNKCGVVGVAQSISDASQLSDRYGIVSEQGIGYAVSSKTAAERFSLSIHN